MTTNVDQKLAGAFTAILILYTIITLGTWQSLEAQTYRHEVIEQTDTVTDPNNNIDPINIDRSNEGGKNNKIKKNDVPPTKAEDFTEIEVLQHTFPIHASDDTEIIDHPGIFLAKPDAMKQILKIHASKLPADGKMTVPKFWRPNCYGPGGVRKFLGNYGENLLTMEQASKIGSFTKEGLKTVYISVASYRDPECQPTVADIFLRAEYPERLRVAIIEQRVEGEDDEIIPSCGQPLIPCKDAPEQAHCKYSHLIDVFVVPAILSVGPVFARHLAYRMYRGEYFAMQVDSHVRFIANWDTDLISQWESANNEMGIMTVYLSDITNSITADFKNNHPNRPIMCKTDYVGQGKLK